MTDESESAQCVGEVLPVAETCATPTDDDCDGEINEEGTDCACTPGTQAECYSGDASTLGAGACKAGTQVCNVSGSGYGPCFGEVTAVSESCTTPIDDDCDGEVNEEGADCVCIPSSTETCYSGPASTAGVGICAFGTRTCDVLGKSWGPCFGEVTPALDVCGGVADENCNGMLDEGCASWAHHFGGLGIERATVAISQAMNEFYVAGSHSQNIDLKLGTNPTLGGAFIGKISAAGDLQWAKSFPSKNATVHGLHAFAEQTFPVNMIIAGEAEAAIDFGGGPLSSASGGAVRDLVLAGFNSSGNHVWSKRYPTNATLWGPLRVAGDKSLTVVAGEATGSIEVGTGPLAPVGTIDAFVAAVTPVGSTDWAHRLGVSNATTDCLAVGVGPSQVLVVTRSTGSVDFGTGPMPANRPILSSYLRSVPGTHQWSKLLTSDGGFEVNDVAVDTQENVILVGSASDSLNLGGGVLPGGTSGADVVIAKLDATGNHVWSQRFGSTASDYGYRVAVDSSGAVVAMGTYKAPMDFGGQTLSPGSNGAHFIVMLDASGKHVYSRGFQELSSSVGPGTATSLSVSTKGALVGSVLFWGPLDMGAGTFKSISGSEPLIFLIPGI